MIPDDLNLDVFDATDADTVPVSDGGSISVMEELSIVTSARRLLTKLKHFSVDPQQIAYTRVIKKLQGYTKWVQQCISIREDNEVADQYGQPYREEADAIMIAAMYNYHRHQLAVSGTGSAITSNAHDMMLLLNSHSSPSHADSGYVDKFVEDETVRMKDIVRSLQVVLAMCMGASETENVDPNTNATTPSVVGEPDASASVVEDFKDRQTLVNPLKRLFYISNVLLCNAKIITRQLSNYYDVVTGKAPAADGQVAVCNYSLAHLIKDLIGELKFHSQALLERHVLVEYDLDVLIGNAVKKAKVTATPSYVNRIYHYQKRQGDGSSNAGSNRDTSSSDKYHIDLKSKLNKFGTSFISLEYLFSTSVNYFNATRDVVNVNVNTQTGMRATSGGGNAKSLDVAAYGDAMHQDIDCNSVYSVVLYCQDLGASLHRELHTISPLPGGEVHIVVRGGTKSNYSNIRWLKDQFSVQVHQLLECNKMIRRLKNPTKSWLQNSKQTHDTNDYYSDVDILLAGFGAQELYANKFSAASLKTVMKATGKSNAHDKPQLVHRYSVEECSHAGYTVAQLYNAGYDVPSLGNADSVGRSKLGYSAPSVSAVPRMDKSAKLSTVRKTAKSKLHPSRMLLITVMEMEIQRQVLIDLYNCLDGPHWKSKDYWCSNTNANRSVRAGLPDTETAMSVVADGHRANGRSGQTTKTTSISTGSNITMIRPSLTNLANWFGVKLDSCGYIISITLRSNRLRGESTH